MGYVYIPNTRDTIRNSAFTNIYITNNSGYPGPDFSIQKPPDSFRIIVVGTSDETGFYTDGPSNYISITNSYFSKDKSKVEVINLSIDGKYRSTINLKLIKDQAIRLNPDLVLFKMAEFPFWHKPSYRKTYKDFTINYVDYNENLSHSISYIDNYLSNKPFLAYVFDYSYIARLAYSYYLNHRRENNKIVQFMKKYLVKDEKPVLLYLRNHVNNWIDSEKNCSALHDTIIKYSMQESLDMIKQVKTELDKKNIKFIIFDKHSDHQKQQFVKLFREHGLVFLLLDVPCSEEYSFGEVDSHLSQKGHQFTANILYKALTDSIIPRKYLTEYFHSGN